MVPAPLQNRATIYYDSTSPSRTVIIIIVICILVLKIIILTLLWRRYQRKKELRETERRRLIEQIALNEQARDNHQYGKVNEQIRLNEQVADRGRYEYGYHDAPAKSPMESRVTEGGRGSIEAKQHDGLMPPPYLPQVPERAASPEIHSPRHV